MSCYGGYSDHLAVVAAFDQWRQAKKKGQQAAFCAKNFVSHGTMLMLDGMRKQLRNELTQKGKAAVEDHDWLRMQLPI